MAKIGDRVRFLNATGGGTITRIDDRMAYVDDDGFETPVLLKELVVVMPAGHEGGNGSQKKMFDQKAFDEGRKPAEKPAALSRIVETADAEPELPVEETAHGEKPTVALAFEPSDVKHLDKTSFAAVVVNDSNYFLDFTFLRRGDGERGWTVVFRGTAAPNEQIDVASLSHPDLPLYEKVAFQCVMYKKNREFTLQLPVSVQKRLDLTKFHKFHCFRPGVYFDTPVLEIPLVSDGIVPSAKQEAAPSVEKELASKFRIDTRSSEKGKKLRENPTKVLPLIEADLHIGELTDSTAGMEPKNMLELQLDTVRRIMKDNSRRIGQKIVFIHGKGEGVLRKEVLSLLKKEYPKAELQDASFREYGFGATLVTIH